MNEKIGFPKQRKYKVDFVKKDVKSKDVADAIGCHSSKLSLYINGRIYMPEDIRNRLDEYLNM